LTIKVLNIARSTSREAYVEATRQLAEFDAQLREVQSRAAQRGEAERRHAQATSDLESYHVRSAEAGEAPTAAGWLERGEGTFLVTASGLSLGGIGAAFWGLCAGLVVYGLLAVTSDRA